MNNEIKVGDLVIVVKPTPCCGNEAVVGAPFIVSRIAMAKGRFHCSHCNTTWPSQMVADGLHKHFVYQLWRLKRIPPLEELDELSEGDLATQRRLHDAWQKDKQPS